MLNEKNSVMLNDLPESIQDCIKRFSVDVHLRAKHKTGGFAIIMRSLQRERIVSVRDLTEMLEIACWPSCHNIFTDDGKKVIHDLRKVIEEECDTLTPWQAALAPLRQVFFEFQRSKA